MPHSANLKIVSHRSRSLRRALQLVCIVIIRSRSLCCPIFVNSFRRRTRCLNSSCTLFIEYFIWPTLLSDRRCLICPRLEAHQLGRLEPCASRPYTALPEIRSQEFLNYFSFYRRVSETTSPFNRTTPLQWLLFS